MVAGCPKCSARYRVDPDRIGPDGAKLRCTKCSAVFLVRTSKAPAAPPPDVDSERLVLIADPDQNRGKATVEAVRSWGLDAVLVHDGVEAMLTIQRLLPKAIVLDAALPKMFGFQVCEVVKRNESLRETTVVLVSAIHHQERYRRDPSELYGADVYLEGPDLPGGLMPLLRDAGLPMNVSEADSTQSPVAADRQPIEPPPPVIASPTPTATPAPDPNDSTLPNIRAVAEPTQPEIAQPPVTPAEPRPPQPPAPPAVDEDPERTAERERAHRLARIAVSEMVLYQPEKFDQASRDGVLEQTMDLEIQEARALLRQRIGDEVRAEADFIIDELHRVAKERGTQG